MHIYAGFTIHFKSSFLVLALNSQADENDVEAYGEEEFDTVLLAIGRQALTEEVAVKEAGVHYNPRNKKIFSENEQTNVPNIYAVGDVLEVLYT